MSNERTERLIIDLAAALTPVRRLPGMATRMAVWVAVAIGATTVTVWTVGPRTDLSLAIWHPVVIWSLAMLPAAAIIAAMGALRLSVPGADRSRWKRWLPISVVGLWAAILPLMTRSAAASPFSAIDHPVHAVCMLRIIAISLIPAVVLMRGIRRGYALDAAWAAAIAMLGSGAVGAVAVALLCRIEQPAHLLASHAAPMAALMAAGVLLGKTLTLQRG